MLMAIPLLQMCVVVDKDVDGDPPLQISKCGIDYDEANDGTHLEKDVDRGVPGDVEVGAEASRLDADEHIANEAKSMVKPLVYMSVKAYIVGDANQVAKPLTGRQVGEGKIDLAKVSGDAAQRYVCEGAAGDIEISGKVYWVGQCLVRQIQQ